MKNKTLKIIEESGLSEEQLVVCINQAVKDKEELERKTNISKLHKSANEKSEKIKDFIRSLFKTKHDKVVRYRKKIDGFIVSVNFVLNYISVDLFEENVQIISREYLCDMISDYVQVEIPEESSEITKKLFDLIDEYDAIDRIFYGRPMETKVLNDLTDYFKGKCDRLSKFLKDLSITEEEKEFIGIIDFNL